MTAYALYSLGRIDKLALHPLLERGAQLSFINVRWTPPRRLHHRTCAA